MDQSHRPRRRGSDRRYGAWAANPRTETVLNEDASSLPSNDSSSAADPLSQLAFIRNTMENASVFTSVPGKGQVVIGFTALVASNIATHYPFPLTSDRWLMVWMCEAVLALGIASFSMQRKAMRAGQSLFSGVGKKVLMNFAPAIFVGALLTVVLHRLGMDAPIPAMWLMLYGIAVISAGVFSVGIVPVMGVCFLALGAVAVFMPIAWIGWTMALGFGVLHIIFGSIIANRHGG